MSTKPDESKPEAEPPGGGRTDHATMAAAASRPIDGPASSGTLASGGGLELPGRERHAGSPAVTAHQPADDIIPGAREGDTMMPREPGGMSGQFSGADIPSTSPAWLDDATREEHGREGGGDQGGQAMRRENAKRERDSKT